MKMKNTLNYPKSAAMGLKKEFETAMANGAIDVRATEVLLYMHTAFKHWYLIKDLNGSLWPIQLKF